MKKPIFHLLFWAMLFSATSCFTTRGYHLNDKNEWQKGPNIDSVATQMLLQATNIWDEPDFFEPAGFKKMSSGKGECMTAPQSGVGTLLEVCYLDPEFETAEVVFIYSRWTGRWHFSRLSGEWSMVSKDYSSPFVPSIKEDLDFDKILKELFTASAKRDLVWLNSLVGDIDTKPRMADTTMIGADSVVWKITFTTDSDFDWTWEYETETSPSSSLVYSFDAEGKCVHASRVNMEMQAYQEKITNPRSTMTMTKFEMSFSIFEISCHDAPPIPTQLTGLSRD